MTIKSIQISNFQSHKKTFLQFHKGLNVICGKTDSGKSGLRRAIEWIVNNRPSGESFKSKWGGDTKVELRVKDKGVKSLISRKKGRENLYVLGEKKYKAFGQDVPEDIKKVLRMSSINIQSQISFPFMLTMSAGETARYLNEIVNLDDIDIALSNIQSTIRQENARLQERRLLKSQYKSDLMSYEWVDETEKRLIFLEVLDNEIQSLKMQEEEIQEIVQKIKLEEKHFERLSGVDIDFVGKELAKIESLSKEIEKDNELISSIESLISDIDYMQKEINSLQASKKSIIKEFEILMPDVCPLCEQEIK